MQTSPELFGKLLLGDEMSTSRSTAPAAAAQPSKSLRPSQSAGRPSSQRAPSRGGQLGATYDTPRGFGDEPLTIDQELAIELESVKKERQQLMESIAQVKAEAGVHRTAVKQNPWNSQTVRNQLLQLSTAVRSLHGTVAAVQATSSPDKVPCMR